MKSHLATLHIPRRHLRKRKPCTIIGMFYVDEFQLKMKNELDLPSRYWTPTLHKCPFKQRDIDGSAKCSTKSLSKLLTCLLSAVKTWLQRYCDTSYSRSSVNQMRILKNSKDLYIQSRPLSTYNSIKTFVFSTLYTTIPYSKLKDGIREFCVP